MVQGERTTDRQNSTPSEGQHPLALSIPVIHSAFVFTCPFCKLDQQETVTPDGPFNAVDCFYCGRGIHPSELTADDVADWNRARAEVS
jgi:hypothetical protein